MKYTLFLLLLALNSCATVDKFAASPAGRAILSGIETTVISAADNAVQQYAATGSVKGKEIAIASMSSVSQQLRGLQATDDAANPAALKQAVKDGSASTIVTQKVAPAVANAVAKAVTKGAPKDVANEAAARALDKAAAKHKG
jgi:hypothetical protein